MQAENVVWTEYDDARYATVSYQQLVSLAELRRTNHIAALEGVAARLVVISDACAKVDEWTCSLERLRRDIDDLRHDVLELSIALQDD